MMGWYAWWKRTKIRLDRLREAAGPNAEESAAIEALAAGC